MSLIRHKYFDQTVRSLTFFFILFIQFRIFTNESFSLSDVVFIFLFPALLIQLPNLINVFKVERSRFFFIGLFITTWIVSYLTPAFYYQDISEFILDNAFILLGALYLVLVLVTFYLINLIYGFQYIAKSFIFSGLIHAFFGILGLLLFFAGIDNSLVCFGCSTSPYLVDFPRVSGFSVSINAYAFSLLISLILIPTQMTNKNRKFMLSIGLFIFTVVILSLSKVMIVAGLSIVLWFIFLRIKSSKSTIMIKISVLVFGMVYALSTHVTFESNTSQKCIYGETIYELSLNDGTKSKICPTFFVQQKVHYWDYAKLFAPWGSGMLAINNINNANPHNTFLERYAFHGVVGVISLLLLIALVFYLILFNKKNKPFDKNSFAITLFWISLFFISINSDVMRYRELWIFFGLLLSSKYNSSKLSI